MIPEAQVKGSRSRRSLLPFISDLSKSLFGTATLEDINTLVRHINALTKRTQEISILLTQHKEGLSSYITKANHRMDNLLQGNTQKLESEFQTMLSLLSQLVQSSSHKSHELDELKYVLQT